MNRIEIEPVDRVEITVLMDNVTDPLLVDEDAVARVNWPKALLRASHREGAGEPRQRRAGRARRRAGLLGARASRDERAMADAAVRHRRVCSTARS
jgi:hypothetical protein